MLDIRFPHRIELSTPIEHAGPLFKAVGSRAFVISGRRAFAAAGDQLEQALRDVDIAFEVSYLDGEPTVVKADKLAADAARFGADSVIGLGGGKALDLSKAVSRRLSVPLTTVPTTAATCAAWTSVYLLYTDDHRVDQHEWLDGVPELVLIDKTVILNAPERYLFSGVGDALAKWVEECHPTDDIAESQIDLFYRLRRRIGSLTRDSLHEFLDACADGRAPDDADAKSEVVDAIIVLAGLPVGLRPSAPRKAVPRLELAHAVYNSWTWTRTGAPLLHGEVVAFGVAVELAIQGTDDAHIATYLGRIANIGLPTRLSQLGLVEDGQVERLAEYVANGIPGYSRAIETYDRADVERALRAVDGFGARLRSL